MSHFLLEEDFTKKQRFTSVHKRIFYLLISLAIIATVVLLIAFLLPRGWEPPIKKTNIIMMVGDGMGPASLTMARISFSKDFTEEKSLFLDPYLVGTVRTYSHSNDVTDSAAAATAYASGIKTTNDVVGVDHLNKPAGTLFEAAKLKQMKTGVVVTTRISDATPACYFSHSVNRNYEYFIINQLLEKDLDVVLGGGKMYFGDNFDKIQSYNYTFVNTTEQMNNVASGKIMGLFADYNIPWEIDRLNDPILKKNVPSLSEMTKKALDLINQNNEHGFILMVEGSKIDVAAHINDAPTQIYETREFDNTFELVREWAEKDGNTIVIVTADHETGGLTLAYQEEIDGHPMYSWSPETLLQVTKSADEMARIITTNATKDVNVTQVIHQYTGITIKPEEEEKILSFLQYRDTDSNRFRAINQQIGRIVSNYAHVGFTTGGHSGVDVNLYTYGDKISPEKFEEREKKDELYTTDNYKDTMLMGNVNNIEIASFISQALGLDLPNITKSLINFDPNGKAYEDEMIHKYSK
ncbi:hypothetical protein DICPUDRAFT_42309 [Dictyostelium purpureum]|uniref:Alkaline phosphatase n=1 Tax=Dictyostelium purpureum TaxID=5786 RepID=F1A1T9_DICPU|nr:uncharacterized protein DICPUDRAFT_42309 [Dictyostelium purpureum]EGC29834.1 hypothetical protein DICPUDRAFT_42309 [Dictyostelium purpureum]|eukprot:XP_003293632.1 hypothetical protein DICPUDRAFT_42309 [Dictyostelium purpureum]